MALLLVGVVWLLIRILMRIEIHIVFVEVVIVVVYSWVVKSVVIMVWVFFLAEADSTMAQSSPSQSDEKMFLLDLPPETCVDLQRWPTEPRHSLLQRASQQGLSFRGL